MSEPATTGKQPDDAKLLAALREYDAVRRCGLGGKDDAGFFCAVLARFGLKVGDASHE
jgi:hypothetical protein